MVKRILKEAFNIKNANYKSKDGNEHKIAYIDPTTSENTFAFKDAIKKFGAKFFSSIKAWGWFLGDNPEYVYHNNIQPCLEYLTTVEDGGKGDRRNKVTNIIDSLIQDLNSGSVGNISMPTVKNVTEALEEFKTDLLNCMTSEEFLKKMEPIIKYQKSLGHRTSLRNCILVMVQDPNATLVKSKSSWFKLNRVLKPNAIPILQWRPDKEPLTPQEKAVIRNKFLANAGVSSVKELDPGQKEELNVQLSGGDIKQSVDGRQMYKIYYAYDIRFTKQIEGKEELVPENPKADFDWYDKSTDQSEYVENLIKGMTSIIENSGLKIDYVPVESMGGALGVAVGNGTIKLSDKPVATINYLDTMIHEYSHHLLHLKYLKKSGNEELASYFVGTDSGRGKVEQQAEMCAWIVMKYFSVATKTSINYASNWGMSAKDCCRVVDSIAECSSFIIKKLGDYITNNNENEQ